MASVPVIETERLTKSYGSARGIEDVTISVEAAEVFGFLGPGSSPACGEIEGLGRAEALAERFRADLDRPLGQLSRGNRQIAAIGLAALGAWLFERRDLSG